MKSLKFGVLVAAMASAALFAAPESYAAGPDVNPLAACGSPTTTILPGIFIVRRSCDGTSVSGIGTTLDDAVTNVNAFAALLDQGLRCNYSSFAPTPGTFDVDFTCSKRDGNEGGIGRAGYIGGVGTTATDAGTNGLGFAQLYLASNGYRCSASELEVLPGGFVTDFGCSFPNTSGGIGRASTVSGIGSTSTDAAQNALGFAELAASIDQRCSTSIGSVRIRNLAFEVDFTCTGARVTGYGSTLTSAGRDALLQAQSL